MRVNSDLQEVLLFLYEAMSSGSAERVESFYSLKEGSVFVGTSAGEFWTDSARHNAEVRHFFDGSQGLLHWTAGEGLAMSEGTVGWTIDRPSILFPDGSRFQARVTLVWHREPDGWKIVHSHASVPAE
jgi:hypothetical protein